MESYNYHLFAQYGISNHFIQDNHSYSVKADVIRGLHYQLEDKAQAKLVKVTSGKIMDVVLDIRHGLE